MVLPTEYVKFVDLCQSDRWEMVSQFILHLHFSSFWQEYFLSDVYTYIGGIFSFFVKN